MELAQVKQVSRVSITNNAALTELNSFDELTEIPLNLALRNNDAVPVRVLSSVGVLLPQQTVFNTTLDLGGYRTK